MGVFDGLNVLELGSGAAGPVKPVWTARTRPARSMKMVVGKERTRSSARLRMRNSNQALTEPRLRS